MQKKYSLLMASVVIGLAAGLSAQDADSSQNHRDQQKPGAQRNPDSKNRPQRKQRSNQPGLRAIFTRLDKNQDDLLTANEIPERIQRSFSDIDTDDSGGITRQELATAFKHRSQKRKAGNRSDSPGIDGKKKSRKTDRMPDAPAMISRFDKDSDQMISIEEAPSRLKSRFPKIDKNGDNQLDAQELQSLIERMKAEGGKRKGRYDTQPEKTKGQLPKRPPSGD